MANNLSLHDKFYNWLITPNVDIRADIYNQIGIFLSEGVRLIVVIDTLTKIAQERSGKRKNSKTKFLESIYNNFVTSGKLSSALKASGNPPETDIITAGEESGRLIDILLFTAKILTSEKEVKSVIRSAMVYPIVLITALLLTLFYSGYSIAPTLEHSVKGLVWHGASALYFSVSKFVDSPYILIIFAVIGIILGIIWWSMEKWTGWGRDKADKFPPWSFYRLLSGVRFMSALSSYLQAGVPMAKAMWEISEKGNLYTRSRVDLVLFNLRQGLNFGESLHETGLNYPDPVIIDAMRVYSELPTFQKLLKESSSKWLDLVLVSAKKQSKIMNTIATLIIGGIIMWIVYVTAVSIPLQINSFVVMHMGGGM